MPGATLAALLIGTGVLYLAGLSASGYANSFYAAAAQAGSTNWTAFLFGSLDGGNAITVDKPPAALWVMAVSVRLFGLSSWSILGPEALMGVGTVAVTYLTVRRVFAAAGERRVGHRAGLAAGLILALTPAAALMFRFDNPDALLALLTSLAVYSTVRAIQAGRARWLVLAGGFVGFGFLTKMLQAFLVLPALAVAYVIFANAPLRRRIWHVLAAGGAMIVTLGWWVALVELVPASVRPYVGGSQHNSILELIVGYNGLGRITGNETGSVTDGRTGAGAWGATGLMRLFDGVSAGMVAWLLPAALILAVLAIVVIGRAPRTDLRRATLVVSGGWLVVTAAVFSFMAGIYHDYYTVALAAPIALCVALGGAVAWQHRDRWPARIGLAAATAVTAVWAIVVLQRAGAPWTMIGWPVGVLGLLATFGWLMVDRLPTIIASVVVIMALGAGITGPAAYTVQTAMTAHSGSIVTAGPAVSGAQGGPGGSFGGPGGFPGGPRGGTGTQGGTGAPGGLGPGGQQGTRPDGTGGGGGGMGGLLDGGASVSSELTQLLRADASFYTWVAATTGSQFAASVQLATQQPVMAIGGFNGSDPSPTLEQFQALVAQGKIHYYLGGSGIGQSNGGSDTAGEIAAWVQQNFTATTVGGVTGYDLTAR